MWHPSRAWISWLHVNRCGKSIVILNILMDHSSSAIAMACTIHHKKCLICCWVAFTSLATPKPMRGHTRTNQLFILWHNAKGSWGLRQSKFVVTSKWSMFMQGCGYHIAANSSSGTGCNSGDHAQTPTHFLETITPFQCPTHMLISLMSSRLYLYISPTIAFLPD